MKKKPKEVIAKGLSLPRDVVFGDFIITLTGNCEAYIENYRGIVSYDEKRSPFRGIMLYYISVDVIWQLIFTHRNQ